MQTPRYTKIVGPLPSTVPFVGPETQERRRGRPFRARIGAIAVDAAKAAVEPAAL